jgi:nucleotide-binding universal stress UspA family protein
MIPIRKILFPVDFSERCTAAAPMVETFAGHFQAELTVFHALEPPKYNDLPHSVDKAEHQLQNYLSDELGLLHVHRVLRRGDPAEQIVEYAHSGKFDLIMLPTHGYGRFRRFIIGSVAAKVLHDADCPVWTDVHVENIPRLEDIAFRRVACAVDLDNSPSCTALRWATQFALEFDAHMTILHAVPGTREMSDVWAYEHIEQDEIRAKEKIQAMKEGICEEADISIVAGEVPQAIREGVKKVNADMLVIGRSTEHGVIGRLRTNSYSIIRRSPCPVISV